MRLFRVFGSRVLATLVALAIITAALGSFSTANATRRTVYNFSGDLRTDFVTVSAASASAPLIWKVLRNPAAPGAGNAFIRRIEFGIGSDSITPGDRFGDSRFELGVWRTGTFYSHDFPEGPGPLGALTVVPWGQTGDAVGRDGDYDADGKDDYTVIRTISGQFNWFYKTATPANDRNVPFGTNTNPGTSLFRFQGADFTGDAREELVIASVNTTTFDVTWYVADSITGIPVLTVQWGNFNSDFIIQPDDYTGDGIADIVFWRVAGDGSWWIRDTATGLNLPVHIFGITDPMLVNNDLACRGDYDGDNIADICVFRPSTREFFWIQSSLGVANAQQWGEAGDTALATFFTF